MIATTPVSLTRTVPANTAVPSLRSTLETWRTRYHVPGVAISVRRAGAPVLDAVDGVANLATGRPLTLDDRFQAASNSKLVTAATVMRLVDAGKLRLDDPLSRWYPTFPDAAHITVGLLLTQRTGVPDVQMSPSYQRDFNAAVPTPWSAAKLVATMAKMRPTQQTGAGWAYSNGNYELLSGIIAAVAHEPFEQAEQEQVIAPAGAGAVARLDPGTGPTFSTVTPYYWASPDGKRPAQQNDMTAKTDPNTVTRTTMRGAGALVTTAAGLAQLGEAVMWDGSHVLTPTMQAWARHEAETESVPAGATKLLGITGYGPGMWAQQIPLPDGRTISAYGHGGDYYGSKSIIAYDPVTQTTVSAMANEQPITWDAMRELAGQLFAATTA